MFQRFITLFLTFSLFITMIPLRMDGHIFLHRTLQVAMIFADVLRFLSI